ncbi:MAG: methionyl-tRNA formyltransferase [Alphaproteobacteria bacterium]|nr:methionyl-tRNA formyltransferase [Alphaproteobacteria bacterium]
MNIVFMGTSDFSLKSLVALHKNHYNIVAVYTQAPKPFGRNQKIHKSVVHEYAESKGIPVYTPKSLKSTSEVEKFSELKADLVIVSSYGLLIPQNILNIPNYGFINIHASLLPRWRGASPIQSAILSGDKESGITIMKMDAGLDTGDIISMKKINITPKTTYGMLTEEMGNLGTEMILETLNNLEENLSKAWKQPNIESTYASKISKDMCKIDWNNSAEIILRKIMAFSPTPSAWTEIEGIRIKILDADITMEKLHYLNEKTKIPGQLCEYGKEAFVICANNSALKLTKIHPAGKNPMSGNDFLRGHKNLVGKIFS